MSGLLVIPASHMIPPTACLIGQSTTVSSAVVGPKSATVDAGVSDSAVTLKRLVRASIIAGCLIVTLHCCQSLHSAPQIVLQLPEAFGREISFSVWCSSSHASFFQLTRMSSTCTTKISSTTTYTIFLFTHGSARHCSIPCSSTNV